MAEEEIGYYFKLNVDYPVGVRFNPRDTIGRVLTSADPYVSVDKKGLRDFKRTNYHAIDAGLIMETQEPSYDNDSPNMIDDEKAAAIVKNVFILRKALADITSPSIVVKLLAAARSQDRPAKTIKMIEKKLAEYAVEEDEDSPLIMKGVDNG